VVELEVPVVQGALDEVLEEDDCNLQLRFWS
jgi:hypothetical protein